MKTSRGNKHNLGRALLAGVAALAMAPCAAQAQAGRTAQVDVQAQSMSSALNRVGRQTGTEITFAPSTVRGLRAPALRGSFTVEQALQRLLAGSGLGYRRTAQGAIVVEPASGELQAAGTAAGTESADAAGIAEILVVGNPSQNTDIRRTEDDAQPYVVFDRAEIENSGASNLEEFFRTRLPMNAQGESGVQPRGASQTSGATGGTNIGQSNISQINLRGLGVAQTLILVDGRRLPRARNFASTNDFQQADINGIPLTAIERIEVLPSTAGGIYGGGAVGGVINIIRRRNYSGLDVLAGFDGTMRGGGEAYRIQASGGFSPDGGITQFSFSASYAHSDPLHAQDNDLWRRARDRYFSIPFNTSASNPSRDFPFGYLPNIRAQSVVDIPCLIAGNPQSACTTIPNLVLRPQYGGAALGSDHTFVPAGYRGILSDNAAALLANAGRYSTDLSDDVNGRLAELRYGTRIWSVNANIRRQITPWLDAFVDFTINDNLNRAFNFSTTVQTIQMSASDPNNPFQQAITVKVPIPGLVAETRSTSRVLAVNGGLVARLGGSWTASAEYGWSKARIETILGRRQLNDSAVLARRRTDPAFSPIQDLNQFTTDYSQYFIDTPFPFQGPLDTLQSQISGRVAGAVIQLPGGPLSVTGAAEHRIETASEAILTNRTYPRRSQSVDSAYVEATLPLVSERTGLSFLRRAEITGSIRHDRYETRAVSPGSYVSTSPPASFSDYVNRFNSTNYTLAAVVSPVRGITFRGSYSTGFLPPNISQIVPTITLMPVDNGFRDPRRGNQPVFLSSGPFNILTGGSPELEPERSRNLSAGVIVEPTFIPGFRLSVDYSRIRKTGEIGFTTSGVAQNNVIAFLEANFPGAVTRGPLTAADQAQGFTGGAITQVAQTLTNIARTSLSALDFQADYVLETPHLGTFRFYVVATRQLHLVRQTRPDLAAFDTVGWAAGPLKWRGNAGINWGNGPVQISWNTQYYGPTRIGSPSTDSSFLISTQGSRFIPSQIYHDVEFRYRFDQGHSGLLAGMDFSVGVQNIFDRRPPVIASVSAIGGYSSYGDARLRRYTLAIRRHF